MKFSFDSSVEADMDVMKGICAVLAGVSATDVAADAKDVKAILVPDKVVADLKEKIVEAVKTEETAKTQTEEAAPATEPVIDPLTSTEEDMMKASSDTLLKILKGLKIDPNKTEGKNTNKKLRDLILEWRKTQASGPASTDDEDDEAPASTEDAIEMMSYEEAKPLIEPFYSDIKKRPAVQELMKKFGAKRTNADGSEACSLGALRDKNEDYRPLVEAIKSHKYDK